MEDKFYIILAVFFIVNFMFFVFLFVKNNKMIEASFLKIFEKYNARMWAMEERILLLEKRANRK